MPTAPPRPLSLSDIESINKRITMQANQGKEGKKKKEEEEEEEEEDEEEEAEGKK